MKIGYYSQQAVDQGFGANFYRTPEGSEVEVTAIVSEDGAGEYAWPDKQYVGPVTDWIRIGRKDKYFSLGAIKYYDY